MCQLYDDFKEDHFVDQGSNMPRCNLTLKQKCHIIELHGEMTTEQIAKKFQVHQTTITRTFQNKQRILEQASRVNCNFKTVQTNKRCQELDEMVIKYIRSRQDLAEPVSIKEICDKATEYANLIDKKIKSKRGWWRRFKVRCNIVRVKVKPNPVAKDKKSSGKKSKYTFYIKETNMMKKDETCPNKRMGKNPSKKSETISVKTSGNKETNEEKEDEPNDKE